MNKEIKVTKSGGGVVLLDANMVQIASRVYSSLKHRKDIIDFWKRSYKLDDKVYCLIISPK